MLANRRLIPAVIALALAAAVAGLVAGAASAKSRHAGVRLAVRPHGPVAVDGVIHARAVVRHPRRTVRVVFRVDGRRAGADRRAPFVLVRPAVGLRPGRHRLRAVAVTRAGRRRAASRWVDVGAAALPRATVGATNEADWARGRNWSSSFEAGNFNEWSWWGQGQSDIWGHIAVVDPATYGVPQLGGGHVARFETTPDDIAHGRTNAKLYQGFSSGGRPPANVSGVYSSWFYVPRSYHVPDHTSVMMFQFKEEYRTPDGKTSDPLWWIQLGPVHWADDMSRSYGESAISGRADAPVAFVNHENNNWSSKRPFIPLPLGRWFAVAAVLRQGDRIDFYLDGHRLGGGSQAQYPVSPFHGSTSMAWTFGIGNYSTGANGPLYADRASFIGL